MQPKVGDWDDFRSHPSLPLALLSSARNVALEFDTILIDTRIDKDWKKTLRQELQKQALCVGITSMTGRQIGYALEVARYVKAVSQVPVVWGGIHCSLLPESTLKNENVDIVVIGEGEISFLELVKKLNDKLSLKGIEGIWFKQAGEIIKNSKRKFAHLNDLPDLPLSLIDLSKYLPTFKGRRTFYIETSRGCPNQCAFCYNSTYNNRLWRAFSAERVIKEIKYLTNRFNIGSYYLIDDNFFVDLERSRAIAEGIIKEQLDIFWEVQGISINSAIKMDEAYLNLLLKSGLKKVHFGVESGSEDLLRQVNKNLKISDVIKVNRNWSDYGIVIQHNFMCGFPGETLEDIRKSKDLAFRLMKENHNTLISPFCPYTPYPGTLLYQKSLKHGFVQKEKLEDWQEADYGDNLWQSAKRKKIISSLFFASMFLDKHRSKDMVQSKLVKILIELYRPIAKFRVKHLFFWFMLEVKVKDFLQGVMQRFNNQ